MSVKVKSKLMPTKRSGILRHHIWQICPTCKEGRWLYMSDQYAPNFTGVCITCYRHNRNREKNNFWKGGRCRTSSGYINIHLRPDDFFYPMTQTNGYVKEHRLIMAMSLGRNLHPWEIVHHINGVKDDNRLENLKLVTNDGHMQITILERRVKYLEALLVQHSISFNNHFPKKVRVEV